MVALTVTVQNLLWNKFQENKNGYPDWWEAFQEKKTRDAQERPLRRDDKATMVTGYVAPPPLAADMSGATHAVLNSHLSSVCYFLFSLYYFSGLSCSYPEPK